MLRFSLATLLIVMGVAALGCAAVANWSPLWAEIMLTTTGAILLVGLLVALFGRGSTRTFATGFAAVGLAYFLLAFFAPAEIRDERLATRRAIDRLFALMQKTNADARTTSEFQLVEVVLDGSTNGSTPGGDSSFMFGVGTRPTLVTGRTVFNSPPREFEDIGHCLWTLLLALIGGVLAQVIQRASRREEAPER